MSLHILTPVATHIEPACEKGLAELERRGHRVCRVRGYSAIDQARCQIASDALAAGAEETLWIDSDIAFNPDDVDRIRTLDLPIVAGIYPKKSKRELACHVLPGTTELVLGHNGGLVELLYASAGFLYVRRQVYETMQRELQLPICNQQFGRPLVPWFMPMAVGNVRSQMADVRCEEGEEAGGMASPHLPSSPPWYLAEDFAFCHRARQCGFKIMADTRIRLAHIGAYAYSWEDAGAEVKRYGSYTFKVK